MSLYMLAASKLSEVTDHSDIGVVVATGLILVFAVLILLYLIITLEGIIFSSLDKKKKGQPPKPAAAPQAPQAAAPKAAPMAAVKVEQGFPRRWPAWRAGATACAAWRASARGAVPGAMRPLPRTPSRSDFVEKRSVNYPCRVF